MNELSEKENIKIEDMIYEVRNMQVILDRDLAKLYGVETRVINQSVKRNIERFPIEFCFQMTEIEFKNWKSQFVTSNSDKMGLRKLPYAFTEQGVAMLSAVLRSETAVKVSIEIIKAFVSMRHYLQANAGIISRLSTIETKFEEKTVEYDKNFRKIFNVLDNKISSPNQGIFFQGQIFDAYVFLEKIIQKAEKEIILIDGYVDLSVLERLTIKTKNVKVSIYTSEKAKLTKLDIQKFNEQYPPLEVFTTTKMHDRFLIIDKKSIYHIGASLKDLGKNCFAFELMQDSAVMIPTILANL